MASFFVSFGLGLAPALTKHTHSHTHIQAQASDANCTVRSYKLWHWHPTERWRSRGGLGASTCSAASPWPVVRDPPTMCLEKRGEELDSSCRDYQTLLARLTRLATGEPTSASLSCAWVTWRGGAFTARSGVDIAITSEGDKPVNWRLFRPRVLYFFIFANEMTVHLNSARKQSSIPIIPVNVFTYLRVAENDIHINTIEKKNRSCSGQSRFTNQLPSVAWPLTTRGRRVVLGAPGICILLRQRRNRPPFFLAQC